MGCHSLLPGIFPTQELNPGLLHFERFFSIWATRVNNSWKIMSSLALEMSKERLADNNISKAARKFHVVGVDGSPLWQAIHQKTVPCGNYHIPTSHRLPDNHLPNCKHTWGCLPYSKETLSCKSTSASMTFARKSHPLAGVDQSGIDIWHQPEVKKWKLGYWGLTAFWGT